MAGADPPFSCDCKTLRGRLVGAGPRNGARVVCYCHDCRAAEVFAGQPDPAPGPVQIYQTMPFRVRLDAGAEQLAPFSFSETGMLRWQARCCGATMFLTGRSPKLSFTSFRTDRLDDDSPLGPVIGRAFVRKSNGKRGHEGFLRLVVDFVVRAIGARLTGKWRDTPFFKADGTPVQDVYLVSRAERDALPLP